MSSGCGDGGRITDVPFKILVANFGQSSYDLVPNLHIATDEQHPTSLIESHISDEEMLRLVPDEPSNDDRKFRKWVFNRRDTDIINRHLSDERKNHLEDDEKPITAHDIEIDDAKDVEEDVRNMLRKKERLWTGKTGPVSYTHLTLPTILLV